MSALAPHLARPWAAGDVAVCIGGPMCPDGRWFNALTGQQEDGPAIGRFVRVIAVEAKCQFVAPEVGLEFAEFAGALYPASAFRRIDPDIEPAADSALVARIIRCGAGVPA